MKSKSHKSEDVQITNNKNKKVPQKLVLELFWMFIFDFELVIQGKPSREKVEGSVLCMEKDKAKIGSSGGEVSQDMA